MNEEILFCINHNGELLWKVSKEEVAEMRRNLPLAEELLREGVENENNMDFSWHDYFVKVRAFLSRPLDAGA